MRVVLWLVALIRADVPLRELDPFRRAGIDAYDLVDELPRGSARLAAWNAYVLQTYGDKLIAASRTAHYVRADTAYVARRLFELVGVWLERAREAAADPAHSTRPGLSGPLPHWHTPVRSREQLVGMRTTLDALRIYVAFDLQSLEAVDRSAARLRARLAEIDARIEAADSLWIARSSEEIRGGIGDALAIGLDKAYALGQLLAQPELLVRLDAEPLRPGQTGLE